MIHFSPSELLDQISTEEQQNESNSTNVNGDIDKVNDNENKENIEPVRRETFTNEICDGFVYHTVFTE